MKPNYPLTFDDIGARLVYYGLVSGTFCNKNPVPPTGHILLFGMLTLCGNSRDFSKLMGLSWPHGHFRGDGGHLVVKAEIQKLNDAGVGSTGQWKDEGACSTCILLVHRLKCDRHPFLCHGACRGASLPEPLSASKLQSFSQQKHLELDYAVLYLPKLFDEGLGILKLLMVVSHLPGAEA